MHIKTDQSIIRRLQDENIRLSTFEKWPLSFLSKNTLAENGFYYKGEEDHVICIFCGVEIGFWEEGDDPVSEHKKYSPNCPIFQPQTDAKLRKAPIGEDECGCVIGEKKVKNYSLLESRFNSFKEWPISMKQTPKDMSKAGFYYTGKSDKVICFSCGLGLNNWEETDNPWVEHAKWNPSCEHLNKEKGEAFIKEVLDGHARQSHEKNSELEAPSTTPIINVNEQLLCRVCYAERRTVVSLPCRHLATCKFCNNKLIRCPICRTEEQNNVEVLLP